MTTYYIGADVHNNSTELAIEKRNKIIARYSVPTTIPAISNVLESLQGKKYPIVRFWKELPGIGLIRATTLFAFMDTPWRFKQKNKLWKYCGVGLQRSASGTDKRGRPKPARLKLPRAVNRTLKKAVLGAAISAINQKDNVFRDYYERMVQDGIITSNARHAVSRKLLTVMWGMWKTNSQFNENLLCVELNRTTAPALSR